MSELEQLVTQIEHRSRKLVKERSELNKEKSQLEVQISELKAIVKNQNLSINELKEKHQVLKIAKTIESEDNNEAVKQLDIYIKEIDRCIALLNS